MSQIINITNSIAAIEALQNLLKGKSDFGEAVPIVRDDDADNAQNVTRILLMVSDDIEAPTWGHTARQCTVDAAIFKSDFSEVATEDEVTQFLQTALDDYDAFNEAGLWGIRLSGMREARADDGSYKVCRITFYYDPRG